MLSAPSFIRVGHIELFARRFREAKKKKNEKMFETREELRLIAEHLIFREYPHIPMIVAERIQAAGMDGLKEGDAGEGKGVLTVSVEADAGGGMCANDRPHFEEEILELMSQCSERIARLTANWIRVGYCQGTSANNEMLHVKIG